MAAIALVALIGAGCSNAPAETASGGTANPATQGSPSTEPDPNAAGGTGGGGDQNAATEGGPIPRENSLEFAECMRENGVEDFPDPAEDEPLVDTNRIPSAAQPGGMSTINAAMQTCRDLAAEATGQ